MPHKKKLITLSTIIVFVLLTTSSFSIQLSKHKKRNLKVLPENISDAKLDSIMQTYNKALGVECSFCHVKDAANNFDYASDTEPMKENARNMMRMTIEINKKYFYFDKNELPEYLNSVTCKTCHRGNPYPLQE